MPARHIGPYELAAHLATRPSSTVYLARRSGLERMFAINLLAEGLPKDVVERARRGAQLAANLNHPGIVRPVDIGTFQDRLYVVTDHVPGVTLKDRLKQGGAVSWREAASLVAAAADAVEVAHQAGVVHRDLKPRSIVIDGRDGKPKVTEFGVARESSSPSMLTQTGDLIGSPVYMSPEQLRGQAADPRSDVYALGVILFELITGKVPFKARTLEDLRREVEAGAPLPLADRAPGVNDELEEALAGALAVDARKRPKTAGAFAEQLRDSLGMASRDSTLSRISRTAVAFGVKPSLLIPLMGLWVVVLGGITGWAVWEHRERLAVRDQLVETLGKREQLERTAAVEEQRRRSIEDEAAQHKVGLAELRESNRKQRAEIARLTEERRELRAKEQELRARVAEQLAQPAPMVDPGKASAGGGALPAQVSAARLIVDGEIKRLANDPKRRLRRATLLHNRGRFREALDVIAAARKAGDPNPRFLILEARTRYKLGDASGAGPLFQKVARDHPNTVDGMFARALSGAPQDLSLLQKAVQKEPTICYVRIMLATRLLEAATKGRDDAKAKEAVAVIDEAIRCDPTSFQAYWTRSLLNYTVWAMRGRKQNSPLREPVLNDLFRARELHPQDAKFWVLAGKTYLEMFERPAAAVPELLEGIRRAKATTGREGLSNQIMGLHQLGRAFQLLKRKSEAAQAWLQSVKLAPQAQAVYSFLSWIRKDPELQKMVLEGLPANVRGQIQQLLEGRGRRRRR